VAGNHVYHAAAAEVHAPKIGAFKPGACRPQGSGSARRRFDSSEKLEPLDSARGTPRKLSKQVTILAQDGVTTVRPGADTPEDQVLFIDGSGAAYSTPEDAEIAETEVSKKAMVPRIGTPGRPRSRRGDLDDLMPETPLKPDSGRRSCPGTPRPCTPSSKVRDLNVSDDDVNVASPGRAAQSSSVDTSNSSDDAEVVEMDCNSPLGNTGAAKELCNIAIKAAVDMAFGQATLGADGQTTLGPCGQATLIPEAVVDAEMSDKRSVTGLVAGICGAAVEYDAAQPADGSSGSLDSLGATAADPLTNTAAFGTTSNNALGNTGLGNTAAAMRLCDDAISAAVGSAVDQLACDLDGSCGSIDEHDMGGTCMTLGGTGRATMGGSMAFAGTAKATMSSSMGLGGTARGAMEASKKITMGASTALGETGKATLGTSMAGTLAMTLGATGDIPPVAPGEGFPGDDSLPSTPTPQGVATLLRGALASASTDNEDNQEASEDNEGPQDLSMTLMSVCHPFSPSPTKKDMMNASLGDSPSIILLDDSHWTPCKPSSRPLSPAAPPSPKAPSRRKSERPVKCGSPTPLSARGMDRHRAEMAALGLPVDGHRGACAGRPRGTRAVAGGA